MVTAPRDKKRKMSPDLQETLLANLAVGLAIIPLAMGIEEIRGPCWPLPSYTVADEGTRGL